MEWQVKYFEVNKSIAEMTDIVVHNYSIALLVN